MHCGFAPKSTKAVACFLILFATLCKGSSQSSVLRVYEGDVLPPEVSAEDAVAVSQVGDEPSLDGYDSARFVRKQSGLSKLLLSEEAAVEAIQLTVYFHNSTSEEVRVVSGSTAKLRSAEAQQWITGTTPRCLEENAGTSSEPIGVCIIPNTLWFRVEWIINVDQCTEDISISLSGSSTEYPASIGKVAVYGPKAACSKESLLSNVPLIPIAIGAAVVALIVIALCCWRLLKPRNEQQSYAEAWQVHDEHPMHPMHPVNQPVQDGRVYAQAPQQPNLPNGQVQQHMQYQYQSPSNQTYATSYSEPSDSYARNNQSSMSQRPRQRSMQHQLAETEPSGLAPKTESMPVKSSVPEALKGSATVSAVTSSAPPPAPEPNNQLVSINSRPAPPAKPPPAVDSQSDDDEMDGIVGPVFDEAQDETPDPTQNAVLKDIHLQQAAGITEMIQGVKDNLMNQRTLKGRDGSDAGLEIFNKIGGGGFGEVFKGKYKGKDVAVKIMKIKPGAKQESLTELPYTEAAIAGICIHANIVQTMYSDLMPVLDNTTTEGGGSFWSRARDERPSRSLARSDSSVKEWQVRMVMEICDLGSVRDWVSPAAGHKYGAIYAALPTKAGTKGCGSRTLCALLTSLDVANGMKLLHKYKILHSDLKPHNVLLCSSHTDPRGFIAKLSDFGLSMKMAAHDGQVPGIKYGTVQYLAPEVLNTHIMTKKADVYSFGIIMWEVWHSRLFAEFYNNEKRKRKANGQSMEDYRPMVSSKCPKSYVQLMTQCLDRNPEKRPDFLGGQVNIGVELERLVHEERQKMSAAVAR